MKAGWKTGALASISEVFTDGNWIESKDQTTDGIRLVQTGNVGEGVFKDRRDKARWIDEDTFARLNCFEVLPGDCLISRLPDPVGRACLIPDTGDKMITAVDCSIVRPDETKIDPRLLVYFTQSREYLRDVDERCSGTTRRRISRKNLGKVPIPLPPLKEQQRIVAVLDEAFEGLARARAHAEANLQNARELFESYLANVFGEGDWQEKTLDQISENLDRVRVPITKSKRVAGDIPYYGASGVVDHVADYLFDEDLLLISEDGANLLARTYPIAFSISGKSWVNNHAHVLRFDDPDTQEFVRLYLNSISLEPYVSGMAQPKLNQKQLNRIPIPFPDNDMRTEIVSRAHAISEETQRLERNFEAMLQDLDDLHQSLLQKAFAGKLT
ncbi:restriction endonuclease subunit S [Primorskyibacter flagellatus]|uniref:restriction endonuclease subunit S n=1 Tax=Primorskyibacter flagellatus TaxID=1387277 RepID=UPI003A93AFDC